MEIASSRDQRQARSEIRRWTRNRKRQPSLLGMIIVFAVIAVAFIAVILVNKGNDLAGHIIEALTLLVMAFTAGQVIIMRESTAMQVSQAVYEDTLKVFEKQNKESCYNAIARLKEKTGWSKEELNEDPEYKKVNEFVYHYEYLGQLVRYNKVDFGLLFDTVTFPDPLWEKLIEGGENSVLVRLRYLWYDKWDGFEYLHAAYELLRKYDELARFDINEYAAKIKGATEAEKKEKAEEKQKELRDDYETAILEWVKVKERLKGKRVSL